MGIGRLLEGIPMGNKTVLFDPSVLCGNLKALREAAHMSQADVAKEIGVSQNSVWKYECARAEPSLRVVCWYAGRFGVSLDELLTVRLNNGALSQAKESEGK